MNKTDELRTARIDSLVTPAELAQRLAVSPQVAQNVTASRRRIEKILNGEDNRLLVIVGPCSIHDLDAAMDYARRLQAAREQHQHRLEIVMRTYFEKPRTVVGWKGLISDPDLNGSYRVNHGIEQARRLLLQVNELGVPTATEFLDMVIGQYIADLISWGAIGARTTESQIHREMASALSCPVGFKNGTDGNTRIAVDAIRAARASHMFLSPDKHGQMTIYQTSGNPYGHIIMRGGKQPNYHAADISAACDSLHEFDLPEQLVIDFSHGNCQKQHRRQLEVCEDVCNQIRNGSRAIAGVMAESFIQEGTQKIVAGQPLVYGQSITDPCLNWEDTKTLLDMLADATDSRF
ncbi:MULTISPECIES: 3-deoxy-7-phosphoheptulonate synthase AroH [Buttiauxella]|jgi:3-deoxy-7-phosphoheptulonate synthase|uniref:Phospho-2-dehydro-3-deoxyheptonate aldolase n=1 Tax=Buttiauxella ferragutiae ATCC 51602 TaxID=1354252 RepID=A0ABX2W4A8_9ENTR|nr:MULTISPECIES: 3-deoxy-7-phosphoheptulonate synthase AroH [Buttiauxella]AYN30045.1 3-deoxy-7-phosphoheptulonate synthase AroH [Buttiauxella sp. 3AFRM03]MCE0827066.1 3-deoxy-7-phosphoheptulonate synthase AroH [Buttiauxella ferragutiae]OAT25512.1 2-keto-3-deoxy-D-arabino-heptulosonate-7-phosphate synthase I [Buttiauxella ferragutiae ATCC 51602]TDN48289.1 3-deoxy-D-arabinoheptulosonate-7-phosphate synthase [Buttiauxella sp. JUb87]UNK59632.1 3-deoxy-7-phosphoheptulonate synthase AroH [Buttiauxel